MQEIIEKLLVLQDRDRKLLRVTQELAHIGPERDNLRAKAASTQSQLDAAKLRGKHIESERKQRDLEIEGKKAQIEKYLNQQLLTRKNEEYKALTHEIEMAKEVIFKIEDAQIVLMEQAEVVQAEIVRATAEAAAARKLVEDQIGKLDQREVNLKKELAELQTGRATLPPLRTDFQEQGRECGGRSGTQRLRRLPYEIARANHDSLPRAAGGVGDLSELRPHPLFHEQHEFDGGGLTPQLPVQRPELNGLRNMVRRNRLRAGEVRDGARHFQNAVVGPGA